MRGLALFVGLAAAAFGQDDKSKGLKAPDLVKKAVAQVGKQKGYQVKINISTQIPGLSGVEEEGIVKDKDSVAVKGTAEIYAKGPDVLIKSGNRYAAPKELDPQTTEGQAGALFKNPALQLAEIDAALKSNDSKLLEDDGDCRVVRIACTTDQKKQQVKDVAKNIKVPSQFGNFGNINVENFVDPVKTESAYKVWIGKKDLLIRKYEWEFAPAVGEGSIPGGGLPIDLSQLKISYTVTIAGYNENLDVEIPKEVKSKLGIR